MEEIKKPVVDVASLANYYTSFGQPQFWFQLILDKLVLVYYEDYNRKIFETLQTAPEKNSCETINKEEAMAIVMEEKIIPDCLQSFIDSKHSYFKTRYLLRFVELRKAYLNCYKFQILKKNHLCKEMAALSNTELNIQELVETAYFYYLNAQKDGDLIHFQNDFLNYLVKKT